MKLDIDSFRLRRGGNRATVSEVDSTLAKKPASPHPSEFVQGTRDESSIQESLIKGKLPKLEEMGGIEGGVETAKLILDLKRRNIDLVKIAELEQRILELENSLKDTKTEEKLGLDEQVQRWFIQIPIISELKQAKLQLSKHYSSDSRKQESIPGDWHPTLDKLSTVMRVNGYKDLDTLVSQKDFFDPSETSRIFRGRNFKVVDELMDSIDEDLKTFPNLAGGIKNRKEYLIWLMARCNGFAYDGESLREIPKGVYEPFFDSALVKGSNTFSDRLHDAAYYKFLESNEIPAPKYPESASLGKRDLFKERFGVFASRSVDLHNPDGIMFHSMLDALDSDTYGYDLFRESKGTALKNLSHFFYVDSTHKFTYALKEYLSQMLALDKLIGEDGFIHASDEDLDKIIQEVRGLISVKNEVPRKMLVETLLNNLKEFKADSETVRRLWGKGVKEIYESSIANDKKIESKLGKGRCKKGVSFYQKTTNAYSKKFYSEHETSPEEDMLAEFTKALSTVLVLSGNFLDSYDFKGYDHVFKEVLGLEWKE